jgi:hypothetical protein
MAFKHVIKRNLSFRLIKEFNIDEVMVCIGRCGNFNVAKAIGRWSCLGS